MTGHGSNPVSPGTSDTMMTTAPDTADPSTFDAISAQHKTDAGGEKLDGVAPATTPHRSDEPGHSTSSALTKHEVPQSISASFDTRDALPQRLIRGTLATCKRIRPSFFQARGVARTKVRPVFYTADPTWLCIVSKHTAELTKVSWNRAESPSETTDFDRSRITLCVIGIDARRHSARGGNIDIARPLSGRSDRRCGRCISRRSHRCAKPSSGRRQIARAPMAAWAFFLSPRGLCRRRLASCRIPKRFPIPL